VPDIEVEPANRLWRCRPPESLGRINASGRYEFGGQAGWRGRYSACAGTQGVSFVKWTVGDVPASLKAQMYASGSACTLSIVYVFEEASSLSHVGPQIAGGGVIPTYTPFFQK